MIRAVIFDLDGTLVDHVGAAHAALRAGLNRLAVTPSVAASDATLAHWQRLERQHFDEYLAGECTFPEQRRRRLLTFLLELGAAAPSAVASEAWWGQYSLDYEAAWTCYPDVLPCLDRLAGRSPRLRLGVLTNGDATQQRAKLSKVGLLDRFDGVFVSSEIGAAKPDPASFHAACDGLAVAANDALFVGDAIEVDALGAAAAGLAGAWLDRANGAIRPSCLRVTSLRDVPDLLGELQVAGHR